MVNGDITVENSKPQGMLQVSSDLHAVGYGEETEGDITLKSGGSMQTDGDLTAANDVKLSTMAGAITTNAAVMAEAGNIEVTAQGDVTTNAAVTAEAGNIEVTAQGDVTTNAAVTAEAGNIEVTAQGDVTTGGELSATEGTITLTSEGGDIAVGNEAMAQGNVALYAEAGSVAINGALTSIDENVVATAEDAVTITANIEANQDVTLTSESAGITQTATAGIQAQTVTTASAEGVDLQGIGNQFGTITVQSSDENVGVQSSDENVGIQGSVLVHDSADKLVLSVQPVVNGNIIVENSELRGVLQVSSDLHAVGYGEEAEGDITLKSGGSMRTDGNLTAANDVKLTSVTGDVSIHGDISTGTDIAVWNETHSDLQESNNALVIHAGGAIHEAEGVKIDTPVVETYSGNGVSMESENNSFGIFLADALEGNTEINGSVKAVSNYYAGEADDAFTVGVGADVRGDAEFTNLHPDGGLSILILRPDDENDEIKVLGGNDAEGNLVLLANKDVNLLGDSNAANDILINSTNGSFSGIGRGMQAGNDVRVSVGEGVYYVGGALQAGNDIHIEALQPDSPEAGIYIGALPEGMQSEGSAATGATSLTAGNEARFDVQGDGDIALEGNVYAGTGDVVANISGEGSIIITKSVESRDESVSVQTGKGDIYIGADNVKDEKTVTANKNVNLETGLGTINILGKTITEIGDITMTAGKDVYEQGTDAGNFIIRDDGELISGGGIALNGRNGDIHITDDILAQKGITVNIAEQGSVFFDRDVAVTNDVDISTDNGNINVGHDVSSSEGTVILQTGEGDITVGSDGTGSVTAEKDVTVSNDGSVTLQSDSGNIHVGDNGPDVDTVTAKENVTLKTVDGTIAVDGKTSTVEGDITVDAHDENEEAGDNLVIAHNGQLISGRDLTLHTYNGNIEVTDDTTAQRNLILTVDNRGDVTFDRNVDVEGTISAEVKQGDLTIGKELNAGEDISVKTGGGNIAVGADVSAGRDVAMTTGGGNITVGEDVTAGRNAELTTVAGDITVGSDGAPAILR